MADGFPTDNAYRVVSDSKGYLWFCTDKGVLRYNGNHFEKFTTAQGLTDNDVFNCFEDSRGRIWFYTYNGKACYYLNGNIYNADSNAMLKQINAYGMGYINCMYEDTEANCLYFGFVQGPILKVTDKEIRKISFRSPLFYDRIRVITKNQDSIIVYTNGTTGYINTDSVALLKEHAPYELFGYGNTITELTPDGVQLRKNGVIIRQIKDTDITYPGAYHAYLDKSRHILVCTPHGLIIHNIVTGTRRHLFPDMVFTSAAQDIYGNYWLTSFGHGVIKLNSGESGEINLLAELNDKEVIATKGRQLFLKAKGKIGYIFASQDTVSIQWTTIPEEKKGTPVLAVAQHLFHVKSGTPEILRRTNTTTEKTETIFKYFNIGYQTDTCRAVVFTYNTMSVACFSDHNIHRGYEHSLSGSIRSAQFDSSSGNLYYISSDALYVLHTYTDKVRLIDSNLMSGGNNNIFCTGNTLILLLNNNRLIIYSKSAPYNQIVNTALPYPVYNIIPFGSQSYIINTDEGYKILSPSRKANLFSTRHIVYPFAQNDILGIYSVQNNLVYKIGNALYTFPNKLLNQRLHKPRLYIERISANDQLIANKGQTIRVNDKTDVHISLSAVHFGNSDIRYKYRIVEDENTSPPYTTSAPELNFKLNAGNYHIEICSVTPNGIESAPKIINIQVSPSFFHSPYFYFLCTLVALSIFSFLLYRNNKRKRTAFLKEMNYLQLEHKAVNGLLNPHFIFNAINNIQNLINNNSQHMAGEYLATLSQLIRQNMENLKFSFIPLARELDLIENYIELQNLRFGNTIRYSLHNGTPDGVSIPPLLIHTFVENAIIHGKRSGQKDFNIDVSVVLDEKNYLYITVTDNGRGIKKSKNRVSGHIRKTSMGIDFTRKRLERLSEFHKLSYELHINDKNETENTTGTTVCILLYAYLNQFSGQTEYPV